MAAELVKHIVRHIKSDDPNVRRPIIGIQLAVGRQILTTPEGRKKYLVAMAQVSKERVGFERCDIPIEMPTEFISQDQGTQEIDPVWVMEYTGINRVRTFLYKLNSRYSLELNC